MFSLQQPVVISHHLMTLGKGWRQGLDMRVAIYAVAVKNLTENAEWLLKKSFDHTIFNYSSKVSIRNCSHPLFIS